MKKGYVNTSKPKSMASRKLRNGNHKKAQKFIDQEHANNLKHMKGKIKTMGKRMNDRSKNPNDPIAHPV